MTKKIFIFGAGSYGRVLLRDIYDINDKVSTWEVLGYVDNDRELIGKKIDGYLVYKHEDLPVSKNYYGICGVGDPKLRKKIVRTEIEPKGYNLPTIVHPTVMKSSDFIAGPGSVIRSGVTIHFDVKLGKCVWLDCNILLGHGGRVGEYTSIYPSSTITGNCTIGRNSIIGAGSTLHQGIKVGNNSMVGIGTTLINDVPDKTIVTDFPRKIVKVLKDI
jgi:sugar O-acyltransferase (sialic acid O-acetyltransferase NeuD family)